MKTAPLKILLLDIEPLYLKGMTDFLSAEPLVDSVIPCHTYDELQQELKKQQSHLVFLELNFYNPRYDGFSICRDIKQQYKNIFLAILSRYNATYLVNYAAECGAGAYFDKHTGPDSIAGFLHSFADNKIEDYYVRISPPGRLPQNPFLKEAFELRYLLTKQECRVMKLIVAGKEHKQIQEQLFISYETFKTHHQHILTKLQVQNDVELTKFALKNNLTAMDCEQLPSYIQQSTAA